METSQEARAPEVASDRVDKPTIEKIDKPNQMEGAKDSSVDNLSSQDNAARNNTSGDAGSTCNPLDTDDDDSEWLTEEEIEVSDVNNDQGAGSSSQQKSASPKKSKRQPPPYAAVLQLKITLKYYKPRIWRRILVSNLDTFEDLHDYIQLAMGWGDCHLHEFSAKHRTKKHKVRISPNREDEEGDTDYTLFDLLLGVPYYETAKENKTRLHKFLRKQGDHVMYMYDFGDGWAHEVVVEDVLPFDTKQEHPQCIGGEKACPPEDCGGVSGYKRLLEIRANPQHEEYNELITEWLEDSYPDFDPDKFEPNDAFGFFFKI